MERLKWIFLTTLLMTPKALAATPAGMTWAACLEEAARNNPQILAARANQDKAEAQVDSAKAPFLPQISANAEAGRNWTGQDSAESAALSTAGGRTTGSNGAATEKAGIAGLEEEFPGRNQFSYGLTIRQSLFAGFGDEARLERSRLGVTAAAASLAKTQAQAAYELRAAFVQNLHAAAMLNLLRKVRDRRKENLRLVGLRFQGGRENKGSVLRSEAALAQSEADVSASERQVRLVAVQLERAMGRKPIGNSHVSEPQHVPKVDLAPDFDRLVTDSPAVKEATAGLQVSESAIQVARSKGQPDLSAFASATRSGDWAPSSTRLAVGLSLTVPLYSGGATSADYRSAVAELSAVRSNFQGLEFQQRLDLETSWVALRDASERLVVARKTLAAAELQATIAQNQYSLGLVSFQDWDLVEGSLADSERSLLQVNREVLLAEAAWWKVRGRTDWRGLLASH